MKWLLITNNNNFYSDVENILLNKDKKNKLICCDFEIENLLKQKKAFAQCAACIIHDDGKKLSAEQNNVIASLYGYFAAIKVPVITDLKNLTGNTFFAKEALDPCNSAEEIISFIEKKYKKVTADSAKRLAKNKLLDRGIPYTSDCFGTYIAKNKIEVVNEFLEAGMSVNSRDDLGTPMLNIACRYDNFEFVEMLLNLGADLNASSEDRGYTAVMDAVWRGNEKITKYLIDKGAELNTINKEGQTNLILAVGANRESLVKLLAENGADPDVKDMMGMSAYTYSVLFKKEKLVEILKPFHKEG